MGTLDAQLCLPVSRREQYDIKLFFALFVGGLLSATLFWTAEGIGGLRGAPSGLREIALFDGLSTPFDGPGLLYFYLVFGGLALAGFYASTLVSGLVQAMAAGAATVIAVLLAVTVLPRVIPGQSRGYLVLSILWPTLIFTVLRCAWRNYLYPAGGWHFWRRNVLAFAGALVFATSLTTVLHYRAWELLTPLEPAHGPARLSLANPPALKYSASGGRITLRLSDGRVREDVIGRDSGWLISKNRGKRRRRWGGVRGG